VWVGSSEGLGRILCADDQLRTDAAGLTEDRSSDFSYSARTKPQVERFGVGVSVDAQLGLAMAARVGEDMLQQAFADPTPNGRRVDPQTLDCPAA